MKRLSILSAILVLALASAALFAADSPSSKKGEAKATPKSMTVTGEIVDLGCYLSEGAKGEAHKGCATMCLSNGMPMGLLTKEGKLYLLTLSHDNADPYNAAKKMAAEQVTVTGMAAERDGISALTVTDVKELNPPAKAN
jgi:hypothetical protein